MIEEPHDRSQPRTHRRLSNNVVLPARTDYEFAVGSAWVLGDGGLRLVGELFVEDGRTRRLPRSIAGVWQAVVVVGVQKWVSS